MRPLIALPPLVFVVWNIAAYQLGWFGAVLGAGAGRVALATLIPFALLGLHLLLVARPMAELRLALGFGAVGLLVDSAQGAAGLLNFQSVTPYPAALAWLTPPWLLGIWMLFATTLHHALSYLKRHLAVAALLGAVAGPLAYLGGAELGAIVLPRATPPTVAALAIAWGSVTPLLCWLARRQDAPMR